ncbi:MAG TPA: ribonuclease III [Acidimicrobiales bacterium]|nr:ribonuclease III [Acidimicrobiales bacterium]
MRSTTWSPSWERADTGEDRAALGAATRAAPDADGAGDGAELSSPAPGRDDAGGAQRAAPAPSHEAARQALAQALGHPFAHPSLLTQALSHRSWCAESGGRPSNERLEFLGDAVLGLVVAEHCYRVYPSLPEGALAKVRAAVVNTAVLAEVAAELGLGEALLLGRGEDHSGGRAKPSILANAVEAVIGAVYIDGGWDAATALVMDLLAGRIAQASTGPGADDFKTRLQELVLHRIGELPRYDVEGTGPDHARRFRAQVYVAGSERGAGEGRSKKDAEQAAARDAWTALSADGDAHGLPEADGRA